MIIHPLLLQTLEGEDVVLLADVQAGVPARQPHAAGTMGAILKRMAMIGVVVGMAAGTSACAGGAAIEARTHAWSQAVAAEEVRHAAREDLNSAASASCFRVAVQKASADIADGAPVRDVAVVRAVECPASTSAPQVAQVYDTQDLARQEAMRMDDILHASFTAKLADWKARLKNGGPTQQHKASL